jgi:hypothetical protein
MLCIGLIGNERGEIMNSKSQKFLTRFFMLALVALFALPLAVFAQGNGKGRGKPTDVFVNGHDARDGRWDKNNGHKNQDRNRNLDNDQWRRRRAAEEQRQREIEAAQRQRDNDQWRRNQSRSNDDWRRRNDDYNRNTNGRNWDQYGGYGGSSQLRQTALNAGYNNGTQEGRKDRSHGDRFDYRDEGDYQNATEDYSSRLGDKELYRRYFREGFATGYQDGYRGY